MSESLVRKISSGGKSYARFVSLNLYVPTRYVFKVDTQIFLVDPRMGNVTRVLNDIAKTEVGTSIMVVKSPVPKAEEEIVFQHIREMRKNSAFFLAMQSKWFHVISLKSGSAINKVKFQPRTMRVIEVGCKLNPKSRALLTENCNISSIMTCKA